MSDVPNRTGFPAKPAGPPRITITGPVKQPATAGTGKSFQEMLAQSLQGTVETRQISFSKHAIGRVEQRGVEISPDTIQQLEHAVDRAREKGITDSLILMDNMAYIVNVPNNVVVTVVDGNDTGHSIFTNIDGAVIV